MERVERNFAMPTFTVARKRVPRAHRYEIDTEMQYRIRGEKQWRKGVVKNISISGALICAHFMQLETAIEMRLLLPIHLQGERAAELFCRGTVVRSAKSEDPDEAAMVAVKFEHWRFFRQRDSKDDSPGILRMAGF
jgi:PilZ domain